ncbi:MAG: hypothetical protein AB7F43_08700 [Bacteriovoracia bacterium]
MLIIAWLVAFFCVVLLTAALFGFGLRIFHPVENNLGFAGSYLGVGAFCSIATLIGVMGFYQFYVQTVLVSIGIFFFITQWSQFRELLRVFKVNKRNIWFLVVPCLYFLVRLFTAGLPQQHSDPLYYHLAAPKLWAELKQIVLTEQHPSYALTGIWEVVYGLPQIWFRTVGVFSHVLAQVTAQWMHVLVGQIACVILTAELFQMWMRKMSFKNGNRPTENNWPFYLFLAWLCTCLPGLEWQGVLAKNSYVLLSFCVCALIFGQRQKWFLAGLSCGFAFATKTLGAWICVGLGVAVFIQLVLEYLKTKKKDDGIFLAKQFSFFVLAGILGSSIFLLRNWVWTKNPVFPNLDAQWGPGWLSTWWANYLTSFGGSIHYDSQMWGWVWDQFLHKALPKVLFFSGFCSLVYLLGKKKIKLQEELMWLVCFGVMFLFSFFMLRTNSDGRYAESTIVVTMIVMARYILIVLSKTRLTMGYLYMLIPLGFLITIPAEQLIKVPRYFLFERADKYIEIYHQGWDFRKWLHQHTEPWETIVSMAEKTNFYLDRRFECVSEMRKWQKILSRYHSAKKFSKGLLRMGYRWVHITPGQILPSELEPYWSEIMNQKPVFSSSTSLIFDLTEFE